MFEQSPLTNTISNEAYFIFIPLASKDGQVLICNIKLFPSGQKMKYPSAVQIAHVNSFFYVIEPQILVISSMCASGL